MDLGLSDRKVLVVGASRGLGAAVSAQLAAEGARVALIARTAAELQRVVDGLPGGASRHYHAVSDLLVDGELDIVSNRILNEWGMPDCIVHNIGGSRSISDTFAPVSDYETVWRLNVGVPIAINNQFAGAMRQKRWGRIVHISSVSAKNYSGYTAYVSAKAALEGYVKSAARVLASDNVIVSAVEPGPIYEKGRYLSQLQDREDAEWREFHSHHLAAGRLAQPEEIAPFVVFLCSDRASFAAGATVNVDGGSR